LEQALVHQRAALTAVPRHPRYRTFLGSHLHNLTLVYQALKQPGAAARAAREWAGLSRGDPTGLYNVACSLALNISLAQGVEREAAASEAIQALKAAVAAGWNDARHTSHDPDLAALRDRDDFRRLLAELFDIGFPAHPFAHTQ
jgi:hypothetical protein